MNKKHIYTKIGTYIKILGPLVGLFYIENYGGDIFLIISLFSYVLGNFIIFFANRRDLND